MIIDYTLVIQTVPELSKKNECVYTCTVGYSQQLGWIRVYPMPYTAGLKRWDTYKLKVEKNNQDSRAESWKLCGYSKHDQWKNWHDDVQFLRRIKESEKQYLKNLMIKQCSPAISVLNNKRLSIGFIKTPSVKARWDVNETYYNPNQLSLFEDVQEQTVSSYTKKSQQFYSRIHFRDEDGSHDLLLNNWQYYEYQRKFGHNTEAFRNINNGSEQLLILGNLFQYRSTWIVLEAFNAPKKNQPLLFDV